MISREQREKDLISSGLVDAIKLQYNGIQHNISDKYFLLIADYIESIGQLNNENGLYLDPVTLAMNLPHLLTSISDEELGGLYGITDDRKITMNNKTDYEKNKLFFFHELTHAIQTRTIDNQERCSYYDGHTGMFLTEGATQFTAEILYNVSNGENLKYRVQHNSVRGQSEHTTFSPLSQYQLNGNILMLLSASLGIPLNQLLALGFRKDAREQLKELYEIFPGKEGKFEEFMFELEKIYSLDKIVLAGGIEQINKQPRTITMQDKTNFIGNMDIQNQIINKIERELASDFIENNDTEYIINNYEKISMYLTTPELKQNFQNAVCQIAMMTSEHNSGIVI